MKGKHPKRRKAKDNPYSICEVDGRYFLSFKDGRGDLQEFEITKTLYDIFNRFELDDLVYLNVWDRHIEHSEDWDNTLYERAVEEPISVEDMIIYQADTSPNGEWVCTLTNEYPFTKYIPAVVVMSVTIIKVQMLANRTFVLFLI